MDINKYISSKPDFLLYFIPGLFALISVSITNPPAAYDDLYRFYTFYNYFKDFSVSEFFTFVKNLPDFLIPIYLYIFSKLGISVNVFLGFITYTTVLIILKLSFLILGDQKKNVFSYLFLLSAISFSGLLSGVRNLHSIAFIYLAIYLYLENKRIKALGSYLISVLTHFSSWMYVVLFVFLKFKMRWIYVVWIASFVGLLFPFILFPYLKDEIEYSPIPIIGKIQHYALVKDYYYTLTQKDGKIIFASFLKFSWYIFMILFLFFKYKRNNESVWVKILFIVSILMNIFLIQLTVFERISLFAKILFVVCLLGDRLIPYKIKKWTLAYFLFLFVIQITLYMKGLLLLE
ncbi:EpsG family protein [Chryseobacterium sp. StRB126]|uniref:EpsG family protein n=1 Tax=Chryseobacterium sp. StRB126 TaxID=878220 RepID=UPI0005EFF44E|nr:EpsG family protein [Chryseobacterium sp. StRB126]